MLGDDWDWPAVKQDVLRFVREQRPALPPPTVAGLADVSITPVSGGGGIAVASMPGRGTPQWLLQKPYDAACERAEAQSSIVQLAQAVSARRGDCPDLAVWAQAAAGLSTCS